LSTKKSKLLESAQKNIQKGLYDRAIKEYEEIVGLDPDIRHRQKLAELLSRGNRKDEAVKEYTSLAKHYEDSIHFVKAIAVYKQIQKLDPTNPDVSLTLASLNVKQGLIGNAIAEYNSALQIYENNQENRKALKVLESLLSLDMRNTAIRLRIAEKYFTIGEEAKSLELFAELARDLRETGDENGYERVAERMRSLFTEKAAALLSEMEGVPESEPEAIIPVPETPPSVPAPSAAPVETIEVKPAPEVPAPAPSLPAEEEIELIEDIIEIEELVEEIEEPVPAGHEWEEEVDLDSLDAHDFGVVTAEEETLQTEEAVELPELELEEIELEEIELELEEIELDIEPEPISAAALSEEPLQFAEKPSDTFDLAGELTLFADELDFNIPQRDNSDATFAAGSAEMFKKNELDRGDAESHYSLGLAYKEMGLYEEAINEFEVASNSPARRIDSLLLQGLCHRDNGDLHEAEKIMTALLQEPTISEDELLSVKYELATCHEISGETDLARRLFTEIVTIRPGFSDAASRLENL